MTTLKSRPVKWKAILQTLINKSVFWMLKGCFSHAHKCTHHDECCSVQKVAHICFPTSLMGPPLDAISSRMTPWALARLAKPFANRRGFNNIADDFDLVSDTFACSVFWLSSRTGPNQPGCDFATNFRDLSAQTTTQMMIAPKKSMRVFVSCSSLQQPFSFLEWHTLRFHVPTESARWSIPV